MCFIPEEHATARRKFVYRALYNKIFTSEVVVNVVLSVVLNMMLRLVGGMIAFKLFGGFAL